MSSANEASTGQQLPGLQGLPAELLDAVLRQLDASSRLQVFRTSKALATALLRRFPSIQLTYPSQHDIQRDNLRKLAPFLTEVLQNRQQPKLHLTLRPAKGLLGAMWEHQKAEPAAAVSSADAIRMIAWMLGAVPLCGAVDCLAISWHKGVHFPWEPAFSATLAASFPFLTSLTLKDVNISICHLATVVSHPLLLPRLLHLDLKRAYIMQKGDLGRSPYIGSRLQELSLSGWVEVDGEHKFLYGLLPFPSTLTQLEMTDTDDWDHSQWSTLANAVSSLTQLQQLRVSGADNDPNATQLLQALAHLPSLNTLVMDYYVVGQQQLGVLLALTQITRLEVFDFSRLTSSRASADCSWRQLKVKGLDWVSAAYLPLHSLTHPLCLQQLGADIEEPSKEVLAAAELNLCERNKAGLVLISDLFLSMATVNMLTDQYLSHTHRTAQHLPNHSLCIAQQPYQPTVASSSSHSGPNTSLVRSSSPEGHITPGGQGSSIGPGGQQGSAAGGQALMQRLGRCVKALRITEQGLGEARLSSVHQQALPALFPKADIVFGKRR